MATITLEDRPMTDKKLFRFFLEAGMGVAIMLTFTNMTARFAPRTPIFRDGKSLTQAREKTAGVREISGIFRFRSGSCGGTEEIYINGHVSSDSMRNQTYQNKLILQHR